jgi:hypothetical protein
VKAGEFGGGDLAVFDQEFEPQLGFVGFLKEHIELGTKLTV